MLESSNNQNLIFPFSYFLTELACVFRSSCNFYSSLYFMAFRLCLRQNVLFFKFSNVFMHVQQLNMFLLLYFFPKYACSFILLWTHQIFRHSIANIAPLNISASLLIEIVYFILPYLFWLHLLFPLWFCCFSRNKCLYGFALLHNVVLYIHFHMPLKVHNITFCSIWRLSYI